MLSSDDHLARSHALTRCLFVDHSFIRTDSTSPTWSNLTEGQRNLRDAVRGKITYTNPSTGKVRTAGAARVAGVA
jgi:hypothetical protein